MPKIVSASPVATWLAARVIVRRPKISAAPAAATMADVFGVTPIFFRVGGSVPITTTFKEALNAESVGLGFSQNGSPIHAPNEWYALEDLPHALKGYAATLIAFGDVT